MIILTQDESTPKPRSIPLSIEEVSKQLNVEYATVRYWLQVGKLKGTKLGKLWRIYPEDVETFINQGWNTGENADMTRRTQAS